MEERVLDSDVLYVDLGQIRRILRENLHIVALSTIAFIVVGAALSFTVFQEEFKSDSKLLLNLAEAPNVITNFRVGDSFLKGLSRQTDPYKNQAELMRSRKLSELVMENLKEKGIKLNVSVEEMPKKLLTINHIKGTDFIELSAKASSPKSAQNIAQAYIEEFLSLSDHISQKPLTEQKEILLTQMKRAEGAFKKVRARIEGFQKTNQTIDITTESIDLVNKLSALNTETQTVHASIAAVSAELGTLKSQINMDTKTALRAVAEGNNETLQMLQNKLAEKEREYTQKALIYAPTNPDMVQLRRELEVLHAQVTNQKIVSVGAMGKNDKNLQIRDGVRLHLVEQMARKESELSAMKNRYKSLKAQKESLEKELVLIPGKQQELARMILNRKGTETVINRLKEKIAEISIQEVSVLKKIQVVDPPTLPKDPLFSKYYLILLAGLIGCALSSVGVVASHYVGERQVQYEYFEKFLNIPVLSVLPWVKHRQWSNHRDNGTLEVLANGQAETVRAYQTLALNLKVKLQSQGKSALSVASLVSEASQSYIAANLACCLGQGGESVIIVDVNLKAPRLHDTFGHRLNYDTGLTEVINTLSEHLYKSGVVDTETGLSLIQNSLTQTDTLPNVHYINAGVRMDNSFEFLNSKGFEALVAVLRANYDWIVFDSSSLLSGPDAYVLLQQLDGQLLVVERDANESHIEKALHQLQQVDAHILGAVLREGKA